MKKDSENESRINTKNEMPTLSDNKSDDGKTSLIDIFLAHIKTHADKVKPRATNKLTDQ